jgi:hypothetical protein
VSYNIEHRAAKQSNDISSQVWQPWDRCLH